MPMKNQGRLKGTGAVGSRSRISRDDGLLRDNYTSPTHCASEATRGEMSLSSSRRLYDRLIAKKPWLRVRRIDENGSAWIAHRVKNDALVREYHSLEPDRFERRELSPRDQ